MRENSITPDVPTLGVWARELGFHLIDVVDVRQFDRRAPLAAWLAEGMHGEMSYMAREPEKRSSPATLVPGTCTALIVSLDYAPADPDWMAQGWQQLATPGAAYVSNYARGRDYHKLVRNRLQKLADRLAAAVGPFGYRAFSDSAPVMEVALAERAGLGWRGKHTLLINRDHGSMMFLGALFTDLPLASPVAAGEPQVLLPAEPETLPPDSPLTSQPTAQPATQPVTEPAARPLMHAPQAGPAQAAAALQQEQQQQQQGLGAGLASEEPETHPGHCGSCRRCLDVCPTQAIIAPYRLDARRCISYLTIELKSSIPVEMRPLIGNRIYGCDDCQLVCPWNKYARAGDEQFAPRHGLERASLIELFGWDEEQFDLNTRGSAIRRIGHERWLRNIAVGLGNLADAPLTGTARTELFAAALSALQSRREHPSALVREHVAWAIGRLEQSA